MSRVIGHVDGLSVSVGDGGSIFLTPDSNPTYEWVFSPANANRLHALIGNALQHGPDAWMYDEAGARAHMESIDGDEPCPSCGQPAVDAVELVHETKAGGYWRLRCSVCGSDW